MRSIHIRRAGFFQRCLRFEGLEQRLPLATDFNDSLSEAVSLGSISTSPRTVNQRIDPDTDVELFRFTVTAGQTVDFDIDTPFNGPGGLGSYLRLFDANGVQLATNNDGAAPGESQVGFDAYLRHTFAVGGTYFIGVSNWRNASYDPITGDRDTTGGQHTVGDYQLIVRALPVDTDDTLTEATSLGRISTSPDVVSARIDPNIDVDLYRFTVRADQTVDFDIDTPFNGPGGLGSHLRLFDANGVQLNFNDDAAAPGENQLGFDAYLRHTFAVAGTYYIGVSNWMNASYNPITGNQDESENLHAIGDYLLTVNTAAPDSFSAASAFASTDSESAAIPTDPAPSPGDSSWHPASRQFEFSDDEMPSWVNSSPTKPSAAALAPAFVPARTAASTDALDEYFAELGARS